MAGTIFLVLLGLYLIVAMKVAEWATIVAIGFKINVPPGFLDNPRRYQVFASLFWLAALGVAVTTGLPSLYKSIPALVLAWPLSIWIGRRRAFDNYRDTHRALIEYEQQLQRSDPSEFAKVTMGQDPKQRMAELMEGASVSNRELAAMLRRLNQR